MTTLAEVADVIRAADDVALACHHHPDGDALGSMLAMHLLCSANGKRSIASWPEPFVVGPHYEFLPGLGECTLPDAFPTDPRVLIAFDLGSVERMGELGCAAASAETVVVLDHHPDTGRFQYPNTTPDVFHLAEELANDDLPIADVTRELFEKHRFPYVQLMSMALARAKLDVGRRFVSAWLTADDLLRYGVAFDETEGFIDHLRGCAEAEVSCVLKEAPGEGLRVSLRSTGDVDVGAIATELGGGGHSFMSGFVSDVSIPETIDRVRERLPVAAGRSE